MLLAIPGVLGLSSFLLAYIPNRKSVARDTKNEKTKRPPLAHCIQGDFDTKLCAENPIEKLAGWGFWATVLFGVVFGGKNLMCGLQWLVNCQ